MHIELKHRLSLILLGIRNTPRRPPQTPRATWSRHGRAGRSGPADSYFSSLNRRQNKVSQSDSFHQTWFKPILYFSHLGSNTAAVLLLLKLLPPPSVSSSLAPNTQRDIVIGPIQVQFPASLCVRNGACVSRRAKIVSSLPKICDSSASEKKHSWIFLSSDRLIDEKASTFRRKDR